jgi:hypothetical protein
MTAISLTYKWKGIKLTSKDISSRSNFLQNSGIDNLIDAEVYYKIRIGDKIRNQVSQRLLFCNITLRQDLW